MKIDKEQRLIKKFFELLLKANLTDTYVTIRYTLTKKNKIFQFHEIEYCINCLNFPDKIIMKSNMTDTML